MKKISIILILLAIPYYISAKQKVFLDNEHIQEYNGCLGKWILLQKKDGFKYFSETFSIEINNILKINNLKKNPPLNRYYFIPYSENYLKDLEKKNICRNFIMADDDEFIWPITDPVKIRSPFGLRHRKFHTGLDVPAIKGTPILASMEGIVIYSNYKTDTDEGYGKLLIIKHKNNLFTRYAHNTANLVKIGDFVKKGQIIGLAGSTGNSTGYHLHFELRCNDIPLDPFDFLPEKKNLNIMGTLNNWK